MVLFRHGEAAAAHGGRSAVQVRPTAAHHRSVHTNRHLDAATGIWLASRARVSAPLLVRASNERRRRALRRAGYACARQLRHQALVTESNRTRSQGLLTALAPQRQLTRRHLGIAHVHVSKGWRHGTCDERARKLVHLHRRGLNGATALEVDATLNL